ncbi:DUF373 family protein [Natronorarus salvus]|uniref:DUF373 family protein n=1 Tax=Natronorarus salvus TaxID=3117733 RepID=UPI002F261F2E
MSTLVVCLDRSGEIAARAGLSAPIVGWEAVRSLVVDVGLADPEDAGVNCLLEALRISRELSDEGEETLVALVSGSGDSVVSADRAVAAQIDSLLSENEIESAVVVIDSAETERLVPIVESRVRVDSVDRVVVRQARDIESTYYFLKQFLADEELRRTTLVPLGIALLVLPAIVTYTSLVVGIAAITAAMGLFLLYKGLGVDTLVARVPGSVQNALYSGQVSVVTYAVAGGLALIGAFAGAIGVSGLENTEGYLLPVMRFVFDSVPWLAAAALVASTGRLLDEWIREGPVSAAYVNLPFGVVALGLVVRGVSAYILQQSALLSLTRVPPMDIGVVSVEGFSLSPLQHLAAFIALGILVSLLGMYTGNAFGEARGVEREAEPDLLD